MRLILDIGNSSLKAGLFDGAEKVGSFRIAMFDRTAEACVTEARSTTDRDTFATRFLEAIDNLGFLSSVTAVGCISVVPEITALISEVLSAKWKWETRMLGAFTPTDLRMGYRTPETLGADRFAAAVAAFVLDGRDSTGQRRPVIALDAGTAVTYEVVSRDGTYLGGPIAPGPALIRQGLNRGTAQLPPVALTIPDHPVGRSTEEALQSGIMFGFLDSVSGMLKRLIHDIDGSPRVIATGGWAEWLEERLTLIHRVDPDLVLEGGRIMLGAEGKE